MPIEFLESVQQFRRSEGGLEIAPPPSGARYKNTPVGRGFSDLPLKFSAKVWKGCPNRQVYEILCYCAPPFLRYREKNSGDVHPPPPSWARVSLISLMIIIIIPP